MGAISMRLLTALPFVLGSAVATPGLNEAVSVAKDLVSASQASDQREQASVSELFDMELTEEDKRGLGIFINVTIYNTDDCGVDGWWDEPCFDKCGEDDWWHETCYDTCGEDDWGREPCYGRCGVNDWWHKQCDKKCGQDDWWHETCYDKCGQDGWWDEPCYDRCGVDDWWHETCDEKCGVGDWWHHKCVSPPIAYCADDADYNETTKITVKWIFFVETSSTDPSNLEKQACDELRDIVSRDHCSTRRKLFGSRRLAIQGYSEEMNCTEVKKCEGDSETCTVFEAAIDIVFDKSGDENNEETVADSVTTIAKDTLNGDEIEENINAVAEDDGEMVTNVGYGDGPEKETNVPASGTKETFHETDNGLSKAEKAAIAIASTVLLLLLILCCLWRRRLRRKQEEAWGGNKSEAWGGNESEAWGGNESVATEDTSPGMPGRGSNSDLDGDDATYRTSDFNNLGIHHSKLDVHMCTSATCDQCNPNMKDPPSVFFISSKGSTPLASTVENDNEDIMSGPAQKGVSSGFRKSTTKTEDQGQRPTSPYETTGIEMEI